MPALSLFSKAAVTHTLQCSVLSVLSSENLWLVGRAGNLTRCLPPVQPAGTAIVLIGRAYSLCCQLLGSPAETVGELVCVVIFLSPQGRSHFIMVPVPTGVTCRVWWDKKCLGGMPAEWSGLNRGRSAGEQRNRAHGSSKISGKCSRWFLPVSLYLG